jgi:mannose-6-phosphate isomerase
MDVASLVPSNTDNGRKSENSIPGGRYKELGSCNYFKSYKYTCDSSIEVEVDESSFASFIFLSGKGSISGKENTVDYKAGDSIFVPASSGKIKVTGKCEFIITRV